MLQTGARTSPFRELSDRINYFAAFVASRESGISSLSPVERFLVRRRPGRGDRDRRGGPGRRRRGDADHPPLPPTIGVPSTPATNTRFLLNELDTAFGARVGERPRAAALRRDPHRRTLRAALRRGRLRRFPRLRSWTPAGGNMGQHFKQHGKDDVAVLVLCRSDHNGGANALPGRVGRDHLPAPGCRGDIPHQSGGGRARAGHPDRSAPGQGPRRGTHLRGARARSLVHARRRVRRRRAAARELPRGDRDRLRTSRHARRIRLPPDSRPAAASKPRASSTRT